MGQGTSKDETPSQDLAVNGILPIGSEKCEDFTYSEAQEEDEIEAVVNLLEEVGKESENLEQEDSEAKPSPKPSNGNGLSTMSIGNVIQHKPSIEWTGVTPDETQLCAAVSGQIYFSTKKDDFNLNKEGVIAECIRLDLNGDQLKETTPRFAICVTGETKKMILGIRGSSTLMDFIMDIAFAPMANRAWHHTAPALRVHGGFSSYVENFLARNEDYILEEIRSRGITEIICTGHSLGGGAAQILQCFLEGQMQTVGNRWNALLGKVHVRSVSFSGVMTMYNDDKNDASTQNFIYKIGSNSTNIIFKGDIVPHAFGNWVFIQECIKAVVKYDKNAKLPPVIRRFVRVSRILKILKDLKEDKKDLVKVMQGFRHPGTIVYYDNVRDTPTLHFDKGPGVNLTETSETKLLRQIRFTAKGKGLMEMLGDHHNFLVRGPGLAYNIPADKVYKNGTRT